MSASVDADERSLEWLSSLSSANAEAEAHADAVEEWLKGQTTDEFTAAIRRADAPRLKAEAEEQAALTYTPNEADQFRRKWGR